MKLFDATNIPLLGKALDVYALRQKVSSSNIANVTTAGYRAQSVSFEDQMTGAMNQAVIGKTSTDDRHIGGIDADALPDARVVETPAEGSLSGDSLASGVNNVDIDHEMADLAKNQIRFKFASRLLTEAFRGIQESIRGQS